MLLFILLNLFWKATGEVYSSYENVRHINKIENQLVQLLGDYISEERERLNTLERFQQYVADSKNYTEPDSYISYPTNQFNVIHRFVADWNNLQEWTNSRSEAITSAYQNYRQYFPGQNDVKGAIKAIHRLQDIYKIKAGHFSRGDPLGPGDGGLVRGQPLNIKALLLFVKDAYENEEWRKCAGWGQQAYYQLQTFREHDPSTTIWFDITDHFAFCLYKTEEIQHAVEITTEMMVHYPDHDRLKGNMKFFKGLVEKGEVAVDESRAKRSVVSEPLPSLEEDGEVEVEITYVPKLYPGADQTILSEETIEDEIQDRHYKKWGERIKKYKKLCKERPALTPQIKQQIERLTCYYKQNTPRSYLKPIKVEVVWPSPRIVVFYDIVSDEEANIMMELAQPHLNRATVHNKNTGKLENAEYRVSKTAWLDDDMTEDKGRIVRRINRRMEDATELSHDYAELDQVNNYGMAGQYEPHYDMATREEKAFLDHEGGNRVATLLFYMGKTDAGGATVFIDGGVRLPPTQNAAVFWYNLLPNGDPDLLTRHAGCPVLAGTKWVMNKWFHVNDQIFTRPCDLQQFKREKEAKLYNGQYTT